MVKINVLAMKIILYGKYFFKIGIKYIFVLFETHGCVEKKQNIYYCRSVCLQVDGK